MAAWGWDEAQQEAFLRQQHAARESQYRGLYPDAVHQVILHNEEPVGRIMTSDAGTEICLIDIALLPDHRSTGIGTTLIHDLQRRAETQGKAVVLSVAKDNQAAALYGRLGFVVTRDDVMYLGMRWTPDNR